MSFIHHDCNKINVNECVLFIAAFILFYCISHETTNVRQIRTLEFERKRLLGAEGNIISLQ